MVDWVVTSKLLKNLIYGSRNREPDRFPTPNGVWSNWDRSLGIIPNIMYPYPYYHAELKIY